MKLTRHNGRTGKNGVYNPKHNDSQFNIDNSDHIDLERAKRMRLSIPLKKWNNYFIRFIIKIMWKDRMQEI